DGTQTRTDSPHRLHLSPGAGHPRRARATSDPASLTTTSSTRRHSMTTATPTAFQRLMRMSLISQIAIGLVLGVALALIAPGATKSVALLGDIFIAALKAVAPILVFVLVAAAIANHKHGQPTHIRPVLTLYLLGTFAAALVAVLASFAFPITLVLD